jgi:beta-lactamase class D
VDHRYIFPVAGGSYPPAEVQEISFTLLRRITEHQRLVKDVLIVEAGRDWILRAKTGWQARFDPQVGWWIGWVERTEGPVFFALNIEMPNQGADLPKREAIARAVLRSIDALPPDSTPHAGAGT